MRRGPRTGMPDISMSLSGSAALDDVAFHPCVRLSRWQAAKQLSFIPPEGRFTLMTYRLGPPTRPHPAAALPLSLKPVVTVGEAGGSFVVLFTRFCIAKY